MKDETKDILIVEFIALKNKMHSFIKIDDKGGKKPKGVNENVTQIMMQKQYKHALFEKKLTRQKMERI